MNLPAHVDGLDHVELPTGPIHLAIGMFDGVHLGHRAVVGAAVQLARTYGGIAGVLTFLATPELAVSSGPPDSTDSGCGDEIPHAPFTGCRPGDYPAVHRRAGRGRAAEFIPWLKRRLPGLAAIYVGENFRFGKARRGDVELLVASGREQDVSVFSAPRVNLTGRADQQHRIRAQLEAGDIEAANALLGYTYFAEGIVTGGKRLGRTIGFPTLNMAWSPDLRPRYGVYAVRVSGPKSLNSLPAVANYGLRPTVERSTEPRLEAHVLGPCPFDEGDEVKMEWVQFIRAEKSSPILANFALRLSRISRGRGDLRWLRSGIAEAVPFSSTPFPLTCFS